MPPAVHDVANHYPNYQRKVGFNLLTGEVLDWVSLLLEWADQILGHFEEFIQSFSLIFDDPNRAHSVKAALQFLMQDSWSVSTYADNFQHLATNTT